MFNLTRMVIIVLILASGLFFNSPKFIMATNTPVVHTEDATARSGRSTNPSVAQPANVQPEDLVTIFLANQNTNNNISSVPEGFIEIGSYGSEVVNHPQITAYYKIATNTEPVDYEFALSTSEAWRIYATRVTNYDIDDPIDQISGATLVGAAASNTITIPGFTPKSENSLLLAGRINKLIGIDTDQVPNGMNKELHINNNPSVQFAAQTLVDSNSTGNKSFVWNQASRAAAIMFNINAPQSIVFNPKTVTSNNLADIATSLLNSPRPNILFIGDSISVSQTWNSSRWPTGFMRAFETDYGYNSFTAGAADPPGASAFVDVSIPATFSGNSFYQRKITNEDYWGDNSFFGSLWHSQDFVMKFGASGYTPGPDGSVINWKTNSSSFNLGQTDDWFTGNNISMQFGYLYDSAVNYATSFDLNNGDLGFSETYNVAVDTEVVGNSILNKGVNLLTDHIPVNDSQPMILANVNGTTNRFFSGAIIKVNNEDNIDGISLATLAQSSASYATTYRNAAPVPGNKQYLQSDMEHYLKSVFTRSNTDNYVFVAFAPEPGPVDKQVIRVNNMIDSLESAYTGAGLGSPKFVLISSWRTLDDERARFQAEVFNLVSNQRSNVAMVSMYALTDGLFLDGSTTQKNWANNKGYDSITLNSGTLDISNQRLIDTSQGYHQYSEEAAFFFAYLLNKEIKEKANI